MGWQQTSITLGRRTRGYHLITTAIETELRKMQSVSIGMLHLFLQHTSAAMTINENADPDVRVDFEPMLNRIVPEGQPIEHTLEGPDDMPAHIKSSLLGCSLSIPIQNGVMALGTWQGIYLCEFRNHATARTILLTVHGEIEETTDSI